MTKDVTRARRFTEVRFLPSIGMPAALRRDVSFLNINTVPCALGVLMRAVRQWTVPMLMPETPCDPAQLAPKQRRSVSVGREKTFVKGEL